MTKPKKPLRGKLSKFSGERRFTDDEIKNIRAEEGKRINAPIDDYVPLFKQLNELYPVEKRY